MVRSVCLPKELVAPVFFQRRALVLRGFANLRARIKRVTRASILYVVCVKIINMWSGA